MKLFIKPTFDNIREDLGYDEFEDVDEDAIMLQQGYDGDIMEVEDGESFEIPKGYVASIIEDEPYYTLEIGVSFSVWIHAVYCVMHPVINVYRIHYCIVFYSLIMSESLIFLMVFPFNEYQPASMSS